MTSKVSTLALSWIRWTAIATAGILAYSQWSAAQGFQSGSNPFAEPQSPDTGGEEEIYSEEYEAPPQSAIRSEPAPEPASSTAPSRTSRGSISVGGKADSKPVASFERKKAGLELSGPGSEKGIQSNGEVAPLSVETISGVGSNEVITDFNFPKADILDIAKTMGRLTGKNFILDKDVRGEVSIISNTSITVGDAWRAFLTALDINGLTVVPSGSYLRIMKQTDAYKKALPMYTNRETPPTDALVTKIFKIKHINAKDLEQPLKSLSGNFQMKLFTLEQTNTLIVTDNASNIARLSKILEFLDIEGFDAGIEVVRVKYASAVEISKLIDQLLPNNSVSVPGFRPSSANNRSSFQPRRTRAGGIVNAIIADERSNNLIVHANPMGLAEVKSLVNRLDQKDTVTVGGGRVHVIYLQFADAEEIAKTITTLNQNGGKSGTSSGSQGSPGSPAGVGVNTSDQNLFEGQIRVAADKPTNSLVVTASPADFATLQRVVNKLDIPRDQVYVEVIIMEMTSERNSEYAANVLLPGGTIVAPTDDLVKTLINPTNIPQGLVLRWKGGGSNSISIPSAGGAAQNVQIPNLAALLKALQTSSNSNVIATPQLMTLDNTKAVFDSTESIPVTQVNSQLGNVSTGVTYQEVPLKIEITPMINKISNFVKLTIKAVLGDILNRELPSAVQNLAYATLKRSAETQVVVADSDTVVLGGLARDKNQETTRKVPLLGDIPILGWLFKSKTSSVGKANVMLFITPKIIRQYEGVRTVLDKKLKERDEFVEKTFGGNDTIRKQRDAMIRSLPDVKNLSYKTRAKDTNAIVEEPRTLTLPGETK
jgi:general secretion pathway protein D